MFFCLRKLKDNKNIVVTQATILLLLNMIFLFFNHFHPQWLTWLVPFWTIIITHQKKENLKN